MSRSAKALFALFASSFIFLLGMYPAQVQTPNSTIPASIALEWSATESIDNCDGPTDEAGRAWYEADFDASTWQPVTVPIANDIELSQDRFYRTTFTVPRTFERVYLSVASDDGIEIYINGEMLSQWGGGCHEQGCVGDVPWLCIEDEPWQDIEVTEYFTEGAVNTLAVHVSNSPGFDERHGNFSYFSLTLYSQQVYLPLVNR